MADSLKSTTDATKVGMIVVNPDGTNVGGSVTLAKDDLPVSGATQAVGVAIVDGSGNQITSFGGGTQYTEGDTDASITGTALMWEDAANTLTPVSSAKPLPVSATIDTTGLATTTTDTNTGTIAGDTTSIDAKIPALGQALAAGSVPVVLTAAQLTTLTPPAAITGFATETTLASIKDTAGIKKITDALPAGDNNIGNVDIATMPAVTNAGTFAVQVDGSALTALQLIDDPVVTLGTTTYTEASTKANVIGAVRRDADTTLVDTTNEISPLQVDANGRLKVEAFSGEALPVTFTGSTDVATQTTLSAINAKLVTGTDIGDVTINNASGGSAVNIQDGGNTITVDYATTGSGTATGALRVELPTNGTGVIATVGAVTAITNALPAGTNAIGKLAANSGVDIGDVDVTSLPALAAGTNTIGAVKSVPSDIDINGSNANHADKYYTNAGAVTDGIVWSPAAGKRWHILTLYINVSAAATVTLEDDLAGGDVVRWKGELAANSGVILKYDKEHPFSSGEDAADLIITTTAGNVYVQAVGYEV